MLISRRRPGGWVDVDQDLLAYLGNDNVVYTELRGNVVPIHLPTGEAPCLYLRCALAPTGAYALICQGQSGAALVSMSGGPFLSIGPCGGANAVEVYVQGDEFVFLRQTSATTAVRRFLNFLSGSLREETFTIPHTSQGFWNGELLTDQIRASVPGMLLPTTVEGLTVGQHPMKDAVVVRFQGKQGVLLEGHNAAPHVTWRPADKMWRIVTRSDRGEFLDILTAEPIPIVMDEVAPWPPGVGWTKRTDIQEIDLVSYFLGDTWSRNGMHVAADGVTYTHHFQSRSGPGWVQHTKFGPPDTRCAVWTFTDKWLGLAYDGTNALEAGYRFVHPGTLETAPIYPRRMRVGKQFGHTSHVELLDLKTGDRQPLTFTGWVEAIYDGPQVGDLAPTTHAVIGFEPASDQPLRGWRELNICTAGQGCWYWHQEKKTANIIDMRWVGTKNVPRILDPEPKFSTFLPHTPDEVFPVAPPKVTITEYAHELRADQDARIVRVKNRNSSDIVTVELVNNSLHVEWENGEGWDRSGLRREVRIVGNAPVPPEPPPDPPSPPSPFPRLAPLQISGKHFVRDNQVVLPWYIHGGDIISRAARDWDGAVRLLDQAAALGADGVRMWTHLLGLPFWAGRTFRPNWDLVARVVEACVERNLQVILSGGDVWQLDNPRQALRETADFIRRTPSAFDWVDGGNETWHNGQEDPRVLAEACRVFQDLGPLVTLTDAPEGSDLTQWMQSPAHVLDLHSQFSDPDGCIRRVWNGGYETRELSWLRIESETRGPGRNVSVCNDFSPSQFLCMMAAAWISGAAPVALCSAGVISDGMKNGHFDQGENFFGAPGFDRISELRNWLPQNVMGWKRVHGGDRAGSPRIFAVPSADETRADHAIDESTGQYVCVISGPTRHAVRQVRDASVVDFPLSDHYRIVKGQVR